MSENTAEVTETAAEETQEQKSDPADLPADHPLVKALAAQKATIRELKGKAARLDELEEAQKSEAEKAADAKVKLEAAEASVPAKVADGLKAHLVALHEIDAEDAELFLTATEPDLLLKQVTRLLGQSDKRRNNHVPREGQNPAAATSDEAAFARDLFGG